MNRARVFLAGVLFVSVAWRAPLALSQESVGRPATAPSTDAPVEGQVVSPKEPADVAEMEVATKPGLRLRVYEVGVPMERLWPVQPDQTPNFETIISELSLSTKEQFGGYDTHFRAEVVATLKIAEAGEYAFRLFSDDGAELRIDDNAILTHDGLHPMHQFANGTARLEPGEHALRVEYFQKGAEQGLRLEWRPPGATDFTTLGGEATWVDATVVPVVSAGPKRLLMPTSSRPGDLRPLESLHPGWRAVTIRPQAGFEPTVSGLAFLPDGRLVVATLDPPPGGGKEGAPGEPLDGPDSAVYVLDGVVEADAEDDRSSIKVTKVADGLYGVAGLCVLDRRILVTSRDGVLELIDGDGDGLYESRRPVVAGAWKADNFHHFTFSLVPHNGFLYTALSTSIMGGDMTRHFEVQGNVRGINGPNPPNRGSIVKIDATTGAAEYIAGGLRTPNGLAVGPDDELFVTDNQGAWLPANALYHVRPGHFYGHYLPDFPYRNEPGGGHPSPFQDRPVTPPAVYLPHSEAANSPTQPLRIPSGLFADQLYVGDVTLGGIARIALERVGDTYQGAAFRHTQGLEAGVNRLCWGPDGALYAGMTGRGPGGNWHWRGTLFGLQKLIPTGVQPLEMHSISATHDGFIIRFTKPIDPAWLAEPGNYRLEQWTYTPTPDYGGPKVDRRDLKVASAEPMADGRAVRLVVPGRKAGYVVYFHLDPMSADGEPMWSTEAWYTLNAVPPVPAEAPAK